MRLWMRFGLVVAFGAVHSVAVAAETNGVFVDSGVRNLQRCATMAVAFRTPTDAWLADCYGGLFRSGDGGRHWVQLDSATPPMPLVPIKPDIGQIRDIIWMDTQVGLILGWPDFVLRTVDAGRTWQRRALPDRDSVSVGHVQRADGHLWLVRAHAALYRSDDGGDRWRQVGTLPSGHQSVSFADRDHGWATGQQRMWKTDDGGASWHDLPLPPNVPWATPFRLTRDLGWLFHEVVDFGKDEQAPTRTIFAYRTRDGGRHWVAAPYSSTSATWIHSRVRIGGRMHELTAAAIVRSEADLERVTPAEPGNELTVLDAHTTVRFGGGGLVFYRDGRRLFESRVLSPPTGNLERLSGVLTPAHVPGNWGWTEGHVYRREEAAGDWFILTDTPEPFERMILVNDVSALARARSGTLYASYGGWFASWYKTTDPIFGWEWSRRVDGVTRALPSPVACLAGAKQASVSIEAEERGCFHYRAHRLELSWRGGQAIVRGGETQRPHELSLQPIAADARALGAQIADIVQHDEGVPACAGSTSSVGVSLKWTCDGGSEQTTKLGAPSCGGSDSGTVAASGGGGQELVRADALLELIRATLPTDPAGPNGHN